MSENRAEWSAGGMDCPVWPTRPERGGRGPQQDFSNGQLIVPLPRHSREDIQEPFVREMQIDPSEYYPEGYMPELLEEWPVDSDLVVPIDKLPASLKQSMGAEWRLREKNRKILEEKGEK